MLTFPGVQKLVRAARKRGQTVVTTNGCFDILHIGHIRYLSEAKRHGDILIVGVNSDASVRRNKGPKRPVVTQKERAEVIASLKPVDAAFIFNDETPNKWLSILKPDVHVKGADRKLTEIVEKDTVIKNGGRVVRARYIDGRSTTNLIKKIAR